MTPQPPAHAAAPNLASSSDPSRAVRRMTSLFVRAAISPARRKGLRRLRELSRRARGAPHQVHYFHQVDDAYSHLAAQALPELASRYEIEIVPHLVGPEAGPNLPEPELLRSLAVRDAAAIAPHYGLAFPAGASLPGTAVMRDVQRALANAIPDRFAETAVVLGDALWSGATADTPSVAGVDPSSGVVQASLAAGGALRKKLGHYSGAMFYYAGEWYWGVDRLHHLEARLAELGIRHGDGPRFPRPPIPLEPVAGGERMTLEVFPSLRSPYTAIAFPKSLELARRTGVRLALRPVLPMVMRGVPATLAKGLYIFGDAAREAAALGAPFGRFVDPIGEPVRRAYALWPWAERSGRGAEYLAAFLQSAFADGVDTSTEAGLQRVVEAAGLSWSESREHRADTAWEAELERNRLTLYEEMGQWGVPSYRLRGPEGEADFATWGQDRLWLLAREIQRRSGSRPADPSPRPVARV